MDAARSFLQPSSGRTVKAEAEDSSRPDTSAGVPVRSNPPAPGKGCLSQAKEPSCPRQRHSSLGDVLQQRFILIPKVHLGQQASHGCLILHSVHTWLRTNLTSSLFTKDLISFLILCSCVHTCVGRVCADTPGGQQCEYSGAGIAGSRD